MCASTELAQLTSLFCLRVFNTYLTTLVLGHQTGLGGIDVTSDLDVARGFVVVGDGDEIRREDLVARDDGALGAVRNALCLLCIGQWRRIQTKKQISYRNGTRITSVLAT